ncbi:MAG: porin family protein [Methylorubrum rhodinum]|uniref:outer membrane protein n=1 Tax=Methylorubrum rhodinum TaxID=29428 RepID=UPI003BAE411D
MKALPITLAALAALTTAASAADLPRRAAPPVFQPVPVFTWTGFYAGFNAGYGFGANDDRRDPTVVAFGDPSPGINPTVFVLPNLTGSPNQPVGGVAAFGNRSSQEGFVGGGQIGYNYQFTPGSGVVVGIEADAQYVDFGRNRNRSSFFTTTGGFPTTDIFGPIDGAGALAPGVQLVNPNGLSGLDYFGTVRGRLGYAFDRTLVYGTGGFAYGAGGGERFGGPGRNDDFRTGWAAGGGFEYALPTDSFLNFFRSSAVTLKVEGLYVSLDRNSSNNVVAYNTTTGAAVLITDPNVAVVSGLTNRRSDEFAVARAGINYKFGSY